jgi:cyclopropane fatty-acyl-phospholipid synthase-like methyltransferase
MPVPVPRSYDIATCGAWCFADAQSLAETHFFDAPLARALAALLAGQSVIDFGCGMGQYVWHFLQAGIRARGSDGNPATRHITGGLCDVADLSKPFDLRYRWDWGMSLEVGEHIPAEFEDAFLGNVTRHAARGLVLSWAVPGQPGLGHVNCRDNSYVIERLQQLGFAHDANASQMLRAAATLWYFPHTLMVFRREAT